MTFFRRWLLILSVLLLGGGQLFAASARENRAYAAAAGAFQDGLYDRAEAAFAQFIEKYPQSARVPEARLLQAQSELKLGKFDTAIDQLTEPNHLAAAGSLADQYVYWTGEAQFLATNYPAAAETWMALPEKFPASRLRLRAVVGAASAFTELAEWPRVAALLETPNGVFLRAAELDPGDEQVAQGQLLLAQAKFALKDYYGASVILESLLGLNTLPAAQEHQCALLLYRVKMAANQPAAALAATTNLQQVARVEQNAAGRAEAMALRAAALEKMGRVTEAIAAYRENLTNAPVERQREAVLKIASLAMSENQFAVATNALGLFLTQFPDGPAADVALLTLGELELKQYAAQPADTNQLAAVQTHFDHFIETFTNSPWLGKAYLDRGWCFWLAQKIPESLADFSTAADRLPYSEDLAVARFKAGDAMLREGKYADALAEYESVLNGFTNLPTVRSRLEEQALYQSLRANLALTNSAGADEALSRILHAYPEGSLSDNAILLRAESEDDANRPEVARALLQQFEMEFPGSELLPEARLAVARTYGQDQNWPAAITNYQNWLEAFPTNELRAQATYSLAAANFQAGDETNAFGLFTNFVAQFPTNALAPLAQWWVADYFFRAGDYPNAERNYKAVFEKWPASDLAYQARMMAGRAAVGRLDYNGAIRDYFSKLEAETNPACPLELRVQATFAHGDALMRADSSDTNNPLANFALATNEFSQIVQLYPTNELGALARFYLGECAAQLGDYSTATNAYALVFNSPFAGIAARSEAQIAFGIALEEKSALAAGGEDRTLQNEALDNYLAVFRGTNLRDDETPDDFWVKKAGLQAAPLVGTLYDIPRQKRFYEDLENKLPQLKESLDKKIESLSLEKN